MTRTTPLRRMILQLRQIFFTDASTFIAVSPPFVARHPRTTETAAIPDPSVRADIIWRGI
jgi:hypothetical protein